jgi:hypothetical protein
MELWRLASVRNTGFWLCMAAWVRTWARSQAEHVETRVVACSVSQARSWSGSAHKVSSPNAKAMDSEFELRLET